MDSLLWKPLLEAAAQTLVGAAGSYGFSAIMSKYYKENSFQGAMDLWKRGIHIGNLGEGDGVNVDGIISPYLQLFPGDPLENAKRYNSLYNFQGKINKRQFQAIEFFAGSDATLRLSSLNGETLVGVYDRYGFVGEGIIAVLPTKLLLKRIPDFFSNKFVAKRVVLSGKISKCPSQHGYVAQSIALKAGLEMGLSEYRNLPYLQISKLKLFNSTSDNIFSLAGSPWAVTDSDKDQYIVQYGQIDNTIEMNNCRKNIINSKQWKNAKVYFDDINCPSTELSFRSNYIL